MGNKHRGVVSAEIGGETVNLRLATNEWAELEEELGKSTGAILRQFQEMAADEDLNMRFLRTVFRAALSYSKPDVTHREAGEMMTEHGLPETAALVGKAIMASMPEQEEGKGNPPKAAAGKK